MDTQSPATPVRLSIRGLGEICSLKNSKMIARGRLMTNPVKQVKIEAYIQSLRSQLFSELRTRGIAISTVCVQPYSTALPVPLDDSRKWISELHVSCVEVDKGEEGCDILIERIG